MIIRRLAVLLLCAGVFCLSQAPRAQYMLMTGAGTAPAGGGGGYTGPGDVVSGADGYWGLRCYNNAYNGNLGDITDSTTGNTTGTRLQCATGNVISALVSGSACTFVTGNACSTLATTCAVACRVEKLYDQSGANACAGATACDASMSTNANRFNLIQVGAAGCTTTAFLCLSDINAAQCLQTPNITLSQPYTIMGVFNHHAASGTIAAILGATSTTLTTQFRNAANVIGASFGTLQTVGSITDGAYHTLGFVANGASGSLSADGANTTSLNMGSNGFTAEAMQLGEWASSPNTCNSNAGSITVEEWLLYGSALTTTQINNQSTNAHSYWGF